LAAQLLGALTTCTGFLTLLIDPVPLIRNYGMGVAMSVMVSWFLTSVWIIPLMLLLPLPRPRKWVYQPARWALWVIIHRRSVVISTIIACGALTYLGRHLYWTGRLFDDLPKGQETRRTTERLTRQWEASCLCKSSFNRQRRKPGPILPASLNWIGY